MTVETYKIKGWEEPETGLLIAENDNWILVKHVPVDYVVDGYKLYAKKYIKSRETGEEEIQIAKVLTLKGVTPTPPKTFEFKEVGEMLIWSESVYGLFEFQDEAEEELFYGKINLMKKNKFMIDMVLADGQIDNAYDYEFSLKKIRAITFEADYFECIRLLMADAAKA